MKRTPQDEAARRIKNYGLSAALEESRNYLKWVEGMGATGPVYARQSEIVRVLEALAKAGGKDG
jgi:hypothetical protein